MKRYLTLILLPILVVSSLLFFGCGEKAVNEKQVIEMTYEHLITKAEQWQNVHGKVLIGRIHWPFTSAVINAMREVINEGSELGKLVEIQFRDPRLGQLGMEETVGTLTSTGALKELAIYQGDGLWSVSIEDWEWEFNERTGEVRAKNEEAAKLLEEITLKTYHNSRYGYYLDYPPSWMISDKDKSSVLIFSGSPDSVDAFILVGVIDEEKLTAYKGLQGYIAARLSSFQSQYHEFELTEITTMRVDYTYMLREDAPRHEAKHYFVQYGNKVYEIVSSAIQPKFESLSSLYDPYKSFRFQP